MAEWKWNPPHESHVMGEAQTEMLAPAGTLRAYGVRECTKCGAKQAEHPAGRFIDDELKEKCRG